MGHHIFTPDLHHLFADLVEVGGYEDLLTVEGYPRAVLSRLRDRQGLHNGFCLLAEPGADHAHVRHYPALFDQTGLVVGDEDCHRCAGVLRVGAQVVVGAVGDPYDLNPAETFGIDLGIPAVGRVVRPFLCQVLAEPDLRGIDTDRGQDLVCQRDVVGDILVCNQPIVHSSMHSHRDRFAVLHLPCDGEERHGIIRVSGK